jgi:hypothetical protein
MDGGGADHLGTAPVGFPVLLPDWARTDTLSTPNGASPTYLGQMRDTGEKPDGVAAESS